MLEDREQAEELKARISSGETIILADLDGLTMDTLYGLECYAHQNPLLVRASVRAIIHLHIEESFRF